jgi:hypothetical protein
MDSDSSLDSNQNFEYSESNFERLTIDLNQERNGLNDRDWKDKLRHMIGELLRYDFGFLNPYDLEPILNLTPTPWTSEDIVFFFYELEKSPNVDDGQECRALLNYVDCNRLNVDLVFEEGIKTSGLVTLQKLIDFAKAKNIIMEVDSIIGSCCRLKEKLKGDGLGSDYLNIFVKYANDMRINLGYYGRGAIRRLIYNWYDNEYDKHKDTLLEQQEVEKALLTNRTCDRPA